MKILDNNHIDGYNTGILTTNVVIGGEIMKLNVPAIKMLMANKQLTNTELSKLSGISRQSIATILGRGTCSVINAGRIAQALEVDITQIWAET